MKNKKVQQVRRKEKTQATSNLSKITWGRMRIHIYEWANHIEKRGNSIDAIMYWLVGCCCCCCFWHHHHISSLAMSTRNGAFRLVVVRILGWVLKLPPFLLFNASSSDCLPACLSHKHTFDDCFVCWQRYTRLTYRPLCGWMWRVKQWSFAFDAGNWIAMRPTADILYSGPSVYHFREMLILWFFFSQSHTMRGWRVVGGDGIIINAKPFPVFDFYRFVETRSQLNLTPAALLPNNEDRDDNEDFSEIITHLNEGRNQQHTRIL